MPTLQETIKKIRLDFGTSGSIPSPLSFGIQTTTPQTLRETIRKVREKPEVSIGDVAREIPTTLGKIRRFIFPRRSEILADIQRERGQTLLPEVAREAILEREKEMFIFRIPEIPGTSFEDFLETPEVDPFTLAFAGAGVIRRTGIKAVRGAIKKVRGITKELQPLAVEARKFKTAEEFVDLPKTKIEQIKKLNDFIKINPKTRELWGTEMGRDLIGDNLPPEEVNIIAKGKNYGWPNCYGNKIHDEKFDHSHSAGECEKTEVPIYGSQAHSAPLGLVFIDSAQFPQSWQGDLLVAYHGSWNRSVPTGYKIVRMNVKGNKITGETAFLTGFLQGTNALGRPVDLEFDSSGSLYISDDKIGVVYKIIKN